MLYLIWGEVVVLIYKHGYMDYLNMTNDMMAFVGNIFDHICQMKEIYDCVVLTESKDIIINGEMFYYCDYKHIMIINVLFNHNRLKCYNMEYIFKLVRDRLIQEEEFISVVLSIAFHKINEEFKLIDEKNVRFHKFIDKINIYEIFNVISDKGYLL